MKKFLSVLLALGMLAGVFGLVAGALDRMDPSTWPVLVLDVPAALEWYDIEEVFSPSGKTKFHVGYYRFIPAESGQYTFEIIGTSSEPILPRFLIWNLPEELMPSTFPKITPTTVYLDGGREYYIMAMEGAGYEQSAGAFQFLVTKTPPLKWWQKLPAFLQFLLRWFAFGWIWMR